MSLKKLYITAEALAKDAQGLTNELAKFNPGIKNNSRESLATLAADAGLLNREFEKLRVEIIEQHERNQRNGI